MNKTRFNEARIMGILRQMENGVPVSWLCHEQGMTDAGKEIVKGGGQDRSQHETAPVPGAQRRRGIARPRRNQIPNHNPGKGSTRIAAVNALSSPDSRQQTAFFRVSKCFQTSAQEP